MDVKLPHNGTAGAIGRAAEDLGAAAMLGGNLFGRVAMHPALADVSDERQRGQVVNDAWRRYGFVNSLSLAAVLAGWAGARTRGDAQARLLSERERRLARAKDAAVATVAVTGILSAIGGVRFSRSAPDGAVPLADGSHPAPDTPAQPARWKRMLNALGFVNALSEIALIGINAALAQEGHRPPPRRGLAALRRA